jgi:hypothetical protein
MLCWEIEEGIVCFFGRMSGLEGLLRLRYVRYGYCACLEPQMKNSKVQKKNISLIDELASQHLYFSVSTVV